MDSRFRMTFLDAEKAGRSRVKRVLRLAEAR
jgi:hypothetical protein